jgi:DNA-binding LacI/PurR family transcriptional regulator
VTHRATIKDVAARAGVSYQTVSRVLNEKPDVADETRQRVLDAMRDLDYQPNLAARALPQRRTFIIGFVISYDPDYLFSDPHLLQILHGANEIAAAHDCALLLSTSRSSDNRISAYERLLGHHYPVDGFLVDGSMGATAHRRLQSQSYPIVVTGYSDVCPCVHSDDRNGVRLMTEHLLSLGHRRIGVIAGPESDRLVTQARLAGHHDALSAAGLPLDPTLLIYGNFMPESGSQGAAALLSLAQPPTAIFAFNDRMAIGAIQYLRATGYRVPEDISVAGFDDSSGAEVCVPPLTTVRQQSLEQGRRAAALLFDLINDNLPHDRHEIVLPAQIIIRHSTAPAKEVTPSLHPS